MEKSQEKAAKRLQKKSEDSGRVPGSGPEIETEPIESLRFLRMSGPFNPPLK